MKKSLSLMLAIALVFGLFNAMASAEVSASTPADAGAYLQKAGIIKGNASGDLLLNDTWEREDVAVLLSRLLGKETEAKNTPKSHTYADVRGTFYDGYLSWAREKGYMEGASATKFGFDAKIDNQSFAAVILRALGVDTTGAENYAKVPELAVKAGILPEGTDWKASATRGTTYVVLVTALNTPVGETGQTLGQLLKLPGFDTVAAVAAASAAGVKKIKVTFNQAVDTEKVSISVKKDEFNVNVSKTSWSADKKEATLETPVVLAAGDYSVTASGITFAEGKDKATFSVTPERVESVWLDDNAYRDDIAGAGLQTATAAVKLLNQYGEEYSIAPITGDISVTSNTPGVTAAFDATNKTVDLGAVSPDRTAVSLTVVDLKFAKSVSKEIKVQPFKSIAEVVISTPELPSGKTALEANMNDVVVPYVAKDQYGNAVKLITADLSKLTFISSDASVLDPTAANAIQVIGDKLTIDLKNFAGPKTVSLTVIVNATGKSSKVEFNVNGVKKANEVQLVAPTAKIGLGDTGIKVELQVKDQYGNAMSADEIIAAYDNGTAATTAFTIVSGNATILAVKAHPNAIVKADGKAYVVIDTVGNKGLANLTVTVNANGKSSTVGLSVVDAKYPVAITLKPDFTKAVYAPGGNAGNIVLKAAFVDQYGDAYTAGTTTLVELLVDNTDFGAAQNVSVNTLVAGVNYAPVGHDKTTKVTAKLYKDSIAAANLVDTKEVTFKSVKSDETLTYVVADMGTISDRANSSFISPYAKGVSVSGKDSSGTGVALPANAIIGLVSSNEAVVKADLASKKVAAVLGQEGDTFVNVTISTPSGTPVTIAAPVKVSKAAPVVVSLVAKANDAEVTKATVALAAPGVAEIADVFAKNGVLWFEVKDQYGTTALGSNTSTVVYVTSPGGAINAINPSQAFNVTTAGVYKVTAVVADKQVVVEVTVQ